VSEHNHAPGLVIIGSGFAGYQTAKQWRLLDTETSLTIITQHNGALYSKPQLSTLQSKIKHPETLMTKTAQQMAEELNAKILAHTKVVEICRDKKILVLDNGELIAYKQCVIAAGAVVNQLALPQEQLDYMVSVNHLEDYFVLQKQLERAHAKKIVVIGSGLVGCELANDFISAGFLVTVVSHESYPMGRFMPKAMAEFFQKKCEDAGIVFKMNSKVRSIEKLHDQLCLHYDDQSVMADVIISAIGFRPDVSLAKKAGLAVDHGIIVNKQFQTSDDSIYAIGDCAVANNHWRPYIAPILHGAKILADVLTGHIPVNVDYPIMPVIAKTPLCPVQGVFDHPEKMATYTIQVDESLKKCFYYNNKKQLKAFVLLGDAVLERQQWVEKLVRD
jgi:rubredoxin-NAD+ reductase